jgi:kynurenine formamidase
MTSKPNTAAVSLLDNLDLLDLSVPLAEDLPCWWATHQPFQHKTWNWFATLRTPAATVYNRSGPYATRWMALDEHTGTHMDAPCHFIPPPGSGLPDAGPAGSISVADVPLEQVLGPAAVLDVSHVTGDEQGVSPLVPPDTVPRWEQVNGQLRAGDIVLFRTGWDGYYRRGPDGEAYVHDVVVTKQRPGWPAPSMDTMAVLLERGVRCVGIDAPSMGPAQDGQGVHVVALREGAVFVECLTGLDRLPARGAWFCFLPLRVEGATGSPGRAVAFLPRDQANR